jgi:hypothetical protein
MHPLAISLPSVDARISYPGLTVLERTNERRRTSVDERASTNEHSKSPRGDYVLPVRIDGTYVPGLPSTVGYLSIETGIEKSRGCCPTSSVPTGNSASPFGSASIPNRFG